MARADEDRVASLLQQGLESYGTGDVAGAFRCWNEALELEPGNEEALDYMRDADRRSKPRGGSADGGLRILEDARRMVQAEGEEAGLDLLMNAPATGRLEIEAMIELLRARLFHRYLEQFGDLSQVPRIASDRRDLRERNLPPAAGFLLSMIDGLTPLGDLVTVSGMDRFETLRSVHRMHQAGILEWVK